MLRGATAVIQSDYTSLQSVYSSPDRVIAGSGRPDGEANADGNRNSPREIGAGLDIRVDAGAEHRDGDARRPGVESVAATVARRCMGREPRLIASTAAVAVTVEPVSGERNAATARTRPLLSAVVQDLPDIPEIVSEQSSAAMPRRHARHTVAGVGAQDVFEDDTGVAETPRRLDGGSDDGRGRVGAQAFGRDGAQAFGRDGGLGVPFPAAAAVDVELADRKGAWGGRDGAGHGGALDGMQAGGGPAQAR